MDSLWNDFSTLGLILSMNPSCVFFLPQPSQAKRSKKQKAEEVEPEIEPEPVSEESGSVSIFLRSIQIRLMWVGLRGDRAKSDLGHHSPVCLMCQILNFVMSEPPFLEWACVVLLIQLDVQLVDLCSRTHLPCSHQCSDWSTAAWMIYRWFAVWGHGPSSVIQSSPVIT